MLDSYDILIVGGGVVGLTLACALAQHCHLSIAILDSQECSTTWNAKHYHHRVSAITLASQRIFKTLHVWESMQQKRVSPFKKIEVWDSLQGKIQFDCTEIGESILGCIIENNVLQTSLQEKLRAFPQVKIIAPVQLTALKTEENSIQVIAEDDRVFSAKLLVGADGNKSWLRKVAGIDVKQHHYEQDAMVTTVRTKLPHQQIARQIFLKNGPLAFLPLLDADLSSIVWSLPKEDAENKMLLNDSLFKKELASTFSHLGEIIEISERFKFPLHKLQAERYISHRIALVGDAAHAVHPLAGQGVNMGLLDAASLTEIIVNAVDARRDFSSENNLRRYERWRRAENFAMFNGIDVLKKIFATNHQIISTGMNLIDHFTWLKNIFTNFAVGNHGHLPKMAD